MGKSLINSLWSYLNWQLSIYKTKGYMLLNRCNVLLGYSLLENLLIKNDIRFNLTD